MSNKTANLILAASVIFLVIGVILALMKVDMILWLPFVFVSMILSCVSVFKRRK